MLVLSGGAANIQGGMGSANVFLGKLVKKVTRGIKKDC